MEGHLSGFAGVEIFFLICGATGGSFVLIRLVMQLIGLDHDISNSPSHELSYDGDHPDTDAGFRILSLHSLSSFFMMFGLVGFAMYRQSKTGVFLSTAGALLAGAASVFAIGKLFAWTAKLQSSGNVQIDSSVGAQGRVYLTIPAGGTGIVCVKVSDRLREYDAKSHDDSELKTDTPVQVLWVEGNVLVVEKL